MHRRRGLEASSPDVDDIEGRLKCTMRQNRGERGGGGEREKERERESEGERGEGERRRRRGMVIVWRRNRKGEEEKETCCFRALIS